MPNGIGGRWDWHLDTDEVTYSSSWKEMLGYADNELANHLSTWKSLVHPEDMDEVLEKVNVFLTGESNFFDAEMRMRHKNNSYIFVSSRGVYITRGLDGNATRLIGSHFDITERKKMDMQLHEAFHRAEQSNKAKSEFLASMSHELRTPLNAIIGFSDLLRHQYFGPIGNQRYAEYAEDIYNSGELLLDLVSDILDLSAIEAGEKTLKKEPLLIKEVIEESSLRSTSV